MPTLIIYLSFISYVIINYKHKNKNAHNKGLFYGIMAYLIQAFFNISVIQTAPIFYMMMGFICSKEESL